MRRHRHHNSKFPLRAQFSKSQRITPQHITEFQKNEEEILKSSGDTSCLQRISYLTHIWLSISLLKARRHWNIALRILNQIIFILEFHAQTTKQVGADQKQFQVRRLSEMLLFLWRRLKYSIKFKSTQRKSEEKGYNQENNEGRAMKGIFREKTAHVVARGWRTKEEMPPAKI